MKQFCIPKHAARTIVCGALFFSVFIPLGAHADDGDTSEPALSSSAFISFTLNGEEADVGLSQEAPSVEVVVSAPEEAHFTRLYICPEAADPCDGSSDIKFFSPNATTTSFTREWDGTTASGEPVEPGIYRITARFFRYGLQPDAFEETAPYTVTILGDGEDEDLEEDQNDEGDEENNEDDDGDSSDGGDDEEMEDGGEDGESDENDTTPAPAVSTLHWTPFTENPETGERVYGEEVIFSDGWEGTVPFNTPGELSLETGVPNFGLEATLFYIPDPNGSTREFVASLGGFSGTLEFTWSVRGVYELDVFEIEAPILIHAPLWHRILGWFVGREAHAEEETLDNFIGTIRFTVLEEAMQPREPAYAECCSSVIFLPGFEGSVLKSGSNTLWPPTPLDVANDLAALRLDDSGNSITSDVIVDGIMNTFLTSPVYEEFTAFMDTLATVDEATGTSTIKSWLPLAYDWRFAPERIIENGITTSTGTIDVIHTIEQLALDSDTGQVTLVAHSNGGLFGKAIIKALQDVGKEEFIDSFVMVGSPQLGTPQAVGGLLHGEGSQLGNWLYTSVTKAQARALGSAMESAYNLLPSRGYFTGVTDPPALFDENAGYTNPWRALWGQAIGNYVELFEFLTDAENTRDVPEEDDTDSPTELDPTILTRADTFHQTYDTYTIPDPIRVVQVAGWGAETIKRIDYLATELYRPFQPPNEKPYYTVQRTIEGDGVVVYPSALSSEGERYYFDLKAYSKGKKKHKDLLSVQPIHALLSSILREDTTVFGEFITTAKPLLEEVEDRLLVAVHSPLTLGVYDSEGNFTGIDPANDSNWEIKFVKNDIPNSSYFEYGESKYLTVPESGSYSFVFEGTDTGTATIVLETITADIQTTTATYSNIPVTPATLAQFTFGTISEKPEISLDKDGDGTTDTTILSDEAKTIHEQQQENSEEKTSDLPPSPRKGGGGIIFRPAAVAEPSPPKAEEPSVSVSEAVIPVSKTPAEPRSDTAVFSDNVILPAFPAVSEPSTADVEVELLQTEPHTSMSTMPTPASQHAAAVQSGWYDVFISFMKETLRSAFSFLKMLF